MTEDANADRKQIALHQTAVFLVSALAAIAAAIYIATTVSNETLHVSHDSALYLEAANTILDGGLPYVDFIDINPPLVMYLHVPAVWLAAALDVNPVNAFFALLILGTLLASAAIVTVLQSTPLHTNQLSILLVALAPGLIFADLNPADQLGQREQFFVLGVIPYLLIRVNRGYNSGFSHPLAFCAGLAAGLMVCLKPQYYSLTIIGAELYVLFRFRQQQLLVKGETVGIVIAPVLYLTLFAGLLPESFAAFTQIYAPIFIESYSIYGIDDIKDLLQIAQADLQPAVVRTIVFCALIRALGGSKYNKLIAVIAIISFCGCCSYLLQAKGWPYHAIPVEAAEMLAVTTLLAAAATRVTTKDMIAAGRTTSWAALLTILVCAGAIPASLKASISHLPTEYSRLVLAYTRPHDRVLFLGFGVWEPYPLLVQTERRPASRYAFSFMLPMLYDGAYANEAVPHGYDVRPENLAAEQRYKAELAADISRYNPSLIVINNKPECHSCPAGLSMVEYLYGQPEQFPFLGRYKKLEERPDFLALGAN